MYLLAVMIINGFLNKNKYHYMTMLSDTPYLYLATTAYPLIFIRVFYFDLNAKLKITEYRSNYFSLSADKKNN